jgi:hypothetical protein
MRQDRNSEKGQALVLVICIMLVVFVVSMTLIVLVRSEFTLGAQHTNNDTSRYIAEAGVYQYLWQLNQDSSFWEDSPSNPLNSSACIAVYKDPSHISGYFQLFVVPPLIAQPYVVLRSTGWLAADNADSLNPAPPANSMKMTSVEVQLSRKEFTNYVDFCNDTVVPAGYGYPGDPGGGDYKWTGDIVNGPYKTNGVLRTGGIPDFKGTVEYGTTWDINYGYPMFDLNPPPGNAGPWPQQKAGFIMPSSNSQLDTWAQADDQANLAYPLHSAEFPGRTCIYLHGSQFDVIYYDPTLKKYIGPHTYNLPPSGVIYVNGSFTTNLLDNSHKWDPSYGNVFVSGTLHGQLTIAAANDIYITPYNPTKSFSQSSASYTGGLWYDQRLTGNPTTDSSNPDLLGLIANYNVRILGSDWPDNSNPPTAPYFKNTNTDTLNGDDINPLEPYTYNSLNPNDGQTHPDITVQAAVMTVNGVFEAEGWNGGTYDAAADPAGAKWQGVTYNWLGGTGVKGHMDLTGSYILSEDGYFAEYGYVQDHGYSENDIYDSRLLYELPPHFLEPLNTGWEIGYWHSIPTAITLSPTTLTQAQVSTAYSQKITAVGGTAPYTYYLASGSLPPGLGLSTTGVLSGTPTHVGTFNFTVATVDQNGFIGSYAYTLVAS